MMSKRILLVEDDQALYQAMKYKLELHGFRVDIVVSGQAALDKIQNNQYDLILLDIIMPKLDGFEVLKRLQTAEYSTSAPIIVTSNLGQDQEIHKGLNLGATDYLIKANLELNELIQKVTKYIGE